MDFYYRKTSSAFFKSLEDASSIHGLENIQSYLPIYNNFLNINEKNYNTIGMNSRYEPVSVVLPLSKGVAENEEEESEPEYNPHFIDLEVVDTSNPKSQSEFKNVFVKYSPLIDPIRFLSGKYSNIDHDRLMRLPKYTGEKHEALEKVVDTNNSAYVDGFFTYLSSKVLQHHKFVHGLEYYGAFIGHKRQFEVDISDDVEFFSSCPFFNSNLGKLFTMDEYSFEQMSLQTGLGKGNNSERAYKPKLEINHSMEDEDSIDIQLDTFDDMGLKKIFTDTAYEGGGDHLDSTKPIEDIYKRSCELNNNEKMNNEREDGNDESDSMSVSSHDSESSNTSSCRCWC
jgi:hypothetical protein